MEWSGEGVVLGTRSHGETSVILEVMTRAFGRHLGLVRGGRSRRLQSVLQPGNTLALTWRARIEDQLGTFTAEPVVSRAARLIETPSGLHGIQTLAGHLRYLAERDPHPALYDGLVVLLDHLGEGGTAARLLVRFEIALLDELGFGLDLSACALTGGRDDLAFVSPKTGRAVGREAAAPWAGRLLALPAFLTRGEAPVAPGDVAAAFALTGHFLDRHVAGPRGRPLSPSRDAFLRAVSAAFADDQSAKP